MNDSEMSGNKKIATWIFNPFHFIAGEKALAAGLAIILLTGFIGSFSNTHFDGVLDFHTGASAPTWMYLLEGLVDWLSLGILIGVGGLILSKSHIRIVDVLGTQALARFPTLITALLALLPGFQQQSTRLAESPFSPEIVPLDMAVFILVALIALVMIIWMVALMYRAYSVACNVHGGKAIAMFIIGLVLAEALSKVVILLMLIRFAS